MLHRHSEKGTYHDRFSCGTDGTAALTPDNTSTEQTEPLSAVSSKTDEQPEKTVSPSSLCQESEPLSYTEEPSPTETETETTYYSVGVEYVKSDSDLPQADNEHVLPPSAGIVYEIAEELYCREKTAAEIEALCQPPFRKVFDRRQLEQLDRQATADTCRLLGESPETPPDGHALSLQQPISVRQALCCQVLMMIPLVNIAAALLLVFRKESNVNIRRYCQAFLMLSALLMTAALGFFAVSYFSDPAHHAFFDRLSSLFGA